jgi:hypothetical protein
VEETVELFNLVLYLEFIALINDLNASKNPLVKIGFCLAIFFIESFFENTYVLNFYWVTIYLSKGKFIPVLNELRLRMVLDSFHVAEYIKIWLEKVHEDFLCHVEITS